MKLADYPAAKGFTPPPLGTYVPPHVHADKLADATDLERATIKKLRTPTNWWEGDANALQVLREYAAKLKR